MTQTANADTGGWTPGQIRVLKTAVAVMGVMLAVGFAALVVALYFQAGKIGKKPPAAAIAAAGEGAPALSHIRLAPGSEITSFSLAGDVLAVQVKTPRGAEIVLIDARSGREINRVTFEPSAK